MNKAFLFLKGTLAAITLALSAPGLAFSADDTIELSFSSPYLERHQLMQQCFLPWIKEMNEKTGGRLVIQFYPPGSLVPEGEIYDSVVNGAVDMGMHMTGRNPGKFPYTAAFDEPFIVPDARSGSLAIWNLFKDVPEIQKEFAETKVLALYASAPYQIVSKTPVHRPGDLADKKIILPIAAHNNMARLLKASPLMLGWPDVYLALERGLADGVFGPIPQVRAAKTGEVCKNITMANLSVGTMYLVMNKDSWEALPDDIKTVLEENSGEVLAERLGGTLDKGVLEDGAWLESTGVSLIDLSAEERDEWRGALAPLHEDWIKAAEEKGMAAARAVMEACLAYGQRYAEQE